MKGLAMHFLNTRPAERSDALNLALQQAGHCVTSLPLLQLVPEPIKAYADRLQAVRYAQVIVVVSPAAAQFGLDALTQLNIEVTQLNAQWIAVGQGTAKLLAQAGITAHVPLLETSEGMLSLPVFEQLRNHQLNNDVLPSDVLTNNLMSKNIPIIMFWRGYGGRQFMMNQLSAQHQMMSIELYDRQLPHSSQVIYQQLLSTAPHALQQSLPQVLLVSSGVSWQNWLKLGQQFGAVYPQYILVLGSRIYAQVLYWVNLLKLTRLEVALPPSVIQLPDLKPTTVVELLKQLKND